MTISGNSGSGNNNAGIYYIMVTCSDHKLCYYPANTTFKLTVDAIPDLSNPIEN